MQYTPNYNFKKPDGNDNYNVANDNSNMDAIDSQLHDIASSAISSSEIGAVNGVASLDATGNVPSNQLGNVKPAIDPLLFWMNV